MQTTKANETLWHYILCKKAQSKKFGLAKRFQSNAEEGTPTEEQHVRVCKQRSPTTDAAAKNSARTKHVKGSAHIYETLRDLNSITEQLIVNMRCSTTDFFKEI